MFEVGLQAKVIMQLYHQTQRKAKYLVINFISQSI